MRKVYILGAGCMGGAILSGLRGKYGASHLRAVETSSSRSACLTACGFEVSERIESIDCNDIVVLAVPPQQFQIAVRDNQVLLSHEGPVISVMAGVTTKSLCRALGHARVIRSIPNTASEVREGITIYYAPENADSDLIAAAQMVFGAIGNYIKVDNECLIDSGTALAGGGPALIAYFANALQQYAENEGFDSEVAWKVCTQLLYGTSMLMKSTGKASMQLCKEVQTVGGTTECAIQVFERNDLNKTIALALTAAADQSVELGK
ncbi:pyrroline-5-carboxylate reductase [Pseudomonas laurylsulfativorans]|uniref:pyrroline-5-carboxylate reductase family protein n=1 Tax=Pseudomonas laurylsulfativorans TaxID=1943631 RepID=UPI00209F5602|nr:pyrroline-5-carboxylate reductase dimerization domain-containing protein [Pseudomonas laurylsulfativorans]MCP1420366.1 pyrroline-5-carboxylate reductase [Pseudomonas laurylsulfativorans]